MRHPLIPPIVPLALAAVLVLAACDAQVGVVSEAPVTVGPGVTASDPDLTPVPGGQTLDPGPLPTLIGTAQTEWGAILVALPATFPIHPDAGIVDLPEVTTASFSVPLDPAAAIGWYVEALGGMGYQVDVSDPLESGTQVLDAASDLPECRIRMDFRPEQDSTIIAVLYGAGCAALGG